MRRCVGREDMATWPSCPSLLSSASCRRPNSTWMTAHASWRSTRSGRTPSCRCVCVLKLRTSWYCLDHSEEGAILHDGERHQLQAHHRGERCADYRAGPEGRDVLWGCGVLLYVCAGELHAGRTGGDLDYYCGFREDRHVFVGRHYYRYHIIPQ